MQEQSEQRFASGREAYEHDVANAPLYHNGQPRRKWDDLSEVARWSWNRNPTARERTGQTDYRKPSRLQAFARLAIEAEETQNP